MTAQKNENGEQSISHMLQKSALQIHSDEEKQELVENFMNIIDKNPYVGKLRKDEQPIGLTS